MLRYIGAFFMLGIIFGINPQELRAAETGSQRIIQAALKAEELNGRHEGEINYWTNSPSGRELLKLEEAFDKRFKLKVKIRQTPITSSEVVNRFVVTGQAGRPPEGDITVLGPPQLFGLHQNGLLEEFDWNGVFGKDFPEIQRRVNTVPAALRNKALELYHLVYVIGYRTDRLKREQLPKTWEEFAAPKWAGRFAAPSGGQPFGYFLSAPGWNEQKVLNLAKAVRDNRAVFVKGSPGVAAALQSGEASLGLTSVGNVEEMKAKGVPMDWIALPGLILAPKSLTVPKGAPHVNLARLFGAWVTTEGRELFESLTKDGLAWPEENSLLAKKLKELGLGSSDYALVDTPEKDAAAGKMLTTIQRLYLGK
ncbi:MAG: extracellular solute-binding protein [Deltaproteobacteria bacterium]|nr:extracellular solute-binding protein [Deltaproteobacteria bacterium]